MKPPFTIHRTDIRRSAHRRTSLAILIVWCALCGLTGAIIWALWGAL